MTRLCRLASLLLLSVVSPCIGLSLFGKKNPPRKTQSLLDHLRQGDSRLNKQMSVVALTGNECGVQYDGAATGMQHQKEELAFVDRSEFITPKLGRETSVGRHVESYFLLHPEVSRIHGKLLPAMHLAIFLSLAQQEKVSAGTFEPYLQTLPTLASIRHLPVFWPAESLNELQHSVVKEAILTRRKEWEEEYDIVQNALQALASDDTIDFVDLDTWFWARSITTSRCFTDQDGKMCLVPYVDMLNHVSPGQAVSHGNHVIQCDWTIDDVGFRLTLPQEQSVQHDDDDEHPSIEISYGRHSNADLLINYGFAILDDEYQLPTDRTTVSLTLPDSANDVEALWEADGLGDCHDVDRTVTVAIGDPGPIQSLLSLCRVACTTGSDLKDMKIDFVQRAETTSQKSIDGLVPQLGATLCRLPFSPSNEIVALEMFRDILMKSLKSFQTTLAHDESLLLLDNERQHSWWRIRKQLGFYKHNAIIVRRGEKLILQHFYLLATFALKFLKQDFVDFEMYKYMLESSLDETNAILDPL